MEEINNFWDWDDEEEPKLSPEDERRIKRKANFFIVAIIFAVIGFPLVFIGMGYLFMTLEPPEIMREVADKEPLALEKLIGATMMLLGVILLSKVLQAFTKIKK